MPLQCAHVYKQKGKKRGWQSAFRRPLVSNGAARQQRVRRDASREESEAGAGAAIHLLVRAAARFTRHGAASISDVHGAPPLLASPPPAALVQICR